jgi:carbohydrate-selective porin OprB
VNEFTSRIPSPPPFDPPDRLGPLELVGRVAVACLWGLGAIAAAVLVLAAAVAAAAVAVALASAGGAAGIRERLAAQPRTVSTPTAELPTAFPKPDLG